MRKAQWIGLLVAAAMALPGAASAQDYPNKVIRIIVPSSAGTAQDVIARIIMPDMSQQLGQTIVVENKTGADQVIGLEYVAKQPADGYNLSLVAMGSLVTLPIFVKDLRFDPLKDLPPVITLTEQSYLFGSSATKSWHDFKALVATLKGAPAGKYTFGSANNDNRLIAELILRGSGVTALNVPYSQAAAYLAAVPSGEVDMGVLTGSAAAAMGNRVQVLGITGSTRNPAMPDVPTFAELGLPQIPGTSYSLNVAAGTPKPVLDKLYAAALHALRQDTVKGQFAKLNMAIVADSTADAAKRQAAIAKIYADIAHQIGL